MQLVEREFFLEHKITTWHQAKHILVLVPTELLQIGNEMWYEGKHSHTFSMKFCLEVNY